MAEKPDKNDGKKARTDLDCDLALGKLQEDETRFGILNEKDIKNIALNLRSLADVGLEIEQAAKQIESRDKLKLKQSVSVNEYFLSGLKNVFHTVDVVLEWLEQSAKKARESKSFKSKKRDAQQHPRDEVDRGVGDQQEGPISNDEKKEGVLRGLYHITALGSYTYYVDLLKLACKFLDIPENPYKAKREHVTACLKEVEEEKQKVVELVEQACHLLQEITREPEFNHDKALEFDNIVQQANVNIEACRGHLSSVEKTINELSHNMTIMKGFSRTLRFAGFGLTCLGLYHATPTESSVDSLIPYVPSAGISLIKKTLFSTKLNYVAFAGLCAASAYAWMSYFPSRAYTFRDELEELKLKHKRLTQGLLNLKLKLENVVKNLSKVRELKVGQSRKD